MQSAITSNRIVVIPPPLGWLDVTKYGVSPANSATANTAALNALVGSGGTAPGGSTLYFPGGTYNFNGAITVNNYYIWQGVGSQQAGGFTIFSVATVTTGFISLNSGFWYTQFRDITFVAATTQVSGACIATNNNVSINFYRCAFDGGASTWWDCISFIGANAANTAIIDGCFLTGFKGNGLNINANGASLTVTNTVIQGQYGTTTQLAASCVMITCAGAVQITNCDIIGAMNNLLVNPTTGLVVASIFITNTYFDYSGSSCILITGAGASVRIKFAQCSFTCSNAFTGSAAVQINTSVAAGAQGIEFIQCSVYNTFGMTGTSYGFLITGGADVTIEACTVAGWTTGISITPIAAGTTWLKAQNNTLGGASGGIATNTNGIVLNAGTYGGIIIQGNVLTGATTPITNSATAPAAANAGNFRITDNAGYNPHGAVTTPTIASATLFTNTTMLRVLVLLKSGTTAPTVLIVNGVTSTVLPLISQIVPILLEPGGTIQFTYTVAPTWQWIGS